MSPQSVPDEVIRISIVERLFARADDDRPLFTHQDHSRRAEHTLTWAEFASRVRVAAGALREVAEPGERVAILAGQELAYPLAFFGALAAGLVAVPLMPPGKQAGRLDGILADAGARVWATSAAAEKRVRGFGDPAALVVVDELTGPGLENPARPAPESPAYLQYTSGSTREPAGAVIAHRAIVASCWQASQAYASDQGTTCAGWIPFFHDMGLIQLLCLPVYAGGRSVFMSPAEFVQRPQRWIRQLSDYPAVFTAAPNFAYDLAAEAGAEDGLDLSDVRVALNGAEPVRPRTVERFHQVFGPHGFRREAHRPSYGLAEATVYVTGTGPDGPRGAVFDRELLAQGRAVETPDGQPVVSVGQPVGQLVRIVHDGREQPDDEVGEVWVHGPNVASGYWGRGDAETFSGVLDGLGGWLRTGDLGVFHHGELYLTGRLKDLIVIDGRNFHPQDIEAAAGEAHPAIRHDRVAAFGVEDGDGEGAMVVAEWARGAEADEQEVTRAVLRAVSREHELTLRAVHLVPSGGLPRTSSGKIARSAAKARYGDLRG